MRVNTVPLLAFGLLTLLAANAVQATHMPRAYNFSLKPGHSHPDSNGEGVEYDGVYVLSQYWVSDWVVYVNKEKGTFLAFTAYWDWSLGLLDDLVGEHNQEHWWNGTDVYNEKYDDPKLGWNDYDVTVNEEHEFAVPHAFVFSPKENHTDTGYAGFYRRSNYIIHGFEVYINTEAGTFMAFTSFADWAVDTLDKLDTYLNGTDFHGVEYNHYGYPTFGWTNYDVHYVGAAALHFEPRQCNEITHDRDGLYILSNYVINKKQVYINYHDDVFLAYTVHGDWAMGELATLESVLNSPEPYEGNREAHGDFNHSPYVNENWAWYFVLWI